MRASWLMAMAAGMVMVTAAPVDLAAQGNSNRARQQQELQRQRERAREQQQREQARERERRAAERERARRQQQAANRAGLVLQRNDRDRYNDRRYDNDRNRDRRDRRYDPWDIYDRRDDRYDNRGPAFCRSGEGHPVKGRQWCREKGFALGRDNSRDIWGDIIFRDRRYDHRQLNSTRLGDILGSGVLGHFDSYGRNYYGSGSLNGRWLDGGATVLQLFMGSTPIARLIDSNGDGRVDNVSLTR